MKCEKEQLLFDHSLKRRSKTLEVSSRFLSPSKDNYGTSSSATPSQVSSPLRGQKPSAGTRKHKTLEESGLIGGIWPSSSPSHSSSNNNLGATLADQLKNERLTDFLERKRDGKFNENMKDFSFCRQKSSSTVFSRFENEKEKVSAKENYRPIIGGSMRYTGKLHFPGKSSSASSSSSSSSNSLPHDHSGFIPGRLSVDENALYRNSKMVSALQRKSESFADSQDSLSEVSDVSSVTSFPSPALGRSPRRAGVEVSSKYLSNLQTRPRRGTSDSNIQRQESLDASPKMKKLSIKNVIKRANSLTGGYGSASSQWALSPGRSGSPPMSVETKERLMSFSSLKPPTSLSRPKGVEKLLDLFKSKKSASSSSLIGGTGNVENIHQLRMHHNRLMQWQYANARADAVNRSINKQAENNVLYVWDGLTKLHHSVLLKKLQLQKEKLEMKLDFILQSQIKPLESWGDMERQHLCAVSMTKQALHSVICRVPLTNGAKVDPKSVSAALRHASDLAVSINSGLANSLPFAKSTANMLSQLAEIVAQEKLLLEEVLDLLLTISKLEIQERCYKCYIIQSSLWQQQLLQQWQQEEMPS